MIVSLPNKNNITNQSKSFTKLKKLKNNLTITNKLKRKQNPVKTKLYSKRRKKTNPKSQDTIKPQTYINSLAPKNASLSNNFKTIKYGFKNSHSKKIPLQTPKASSSDKTFRAKKIKN